MRSLSKMFGPRIDEVRPIVLQPGGYIIEAPKEKTDDEIIEEMEEALLKGPPLPPMTKEMKELFEVIDKAPLKAQTLIMTEQDYEDIKRWKP